MNHPTIPIRSNSIFNIKLGGGILRLTVEDILQVDGLIMANSVDLYSSGAGSGTSGGSGGSGGSIWIEAGAFIGEFLHI